jgi:hypothetical protein
MLDGWIENGFDRLVKFDRAGDDLLRVEMATPHVLDNSWHFRAGMDASKVKRDANTLVVAQRNFSQCFHVTIGAMADASMPG